MSRRTQYSYEVAERIRREQRLARLKETTVARCEQVSQQYDECVRQGLDQYLPAEFPQVEQSLHTIAASVETDPEAASQASLKLAADMSRLSALARETQREFAAQYRERLQQLSQERGEAQSTLHAFVQQQFTAFQDPVIRDFAFEDLRALQQSYVDSTVAPHELDAEKQRIRQRVQAIRSEAGQKAEAWKHEKDAQVQAAAQQQLLQMHRDQLTHDVAENPKELQALLSDLDTIQQRLTETGALDAEEFQQEIEKTATQADEAVVDERCRKETVRAVLQSLRRAGFVVETPRRHKDYAHDDVVVLARKPAGQQAEFRVTLDGGFLYKFDRYEGLTCKKDIDKILPMLQQIYGVQLSNRRVLWENPVPESHTARPLTPVTQEQGHGC